MEKKSIIREKLGFRRKPDEEKKTEERKPLGESIKNFIRKEPVTTVSGVLALISVFIVRPDAEYLEYIHWSTLSILLSLMLITAGLKALGVFKAIGHRMLHYAKSPRSIIFILVGLCFVLAPFITNDVCLITFVPFAIYILEIAGLRKYIIPTLALQTVAAHMGSSLSPVGNPHNLYLYGLSGLSTGEFIIHMAPYFVASGVMLALAILVVTRKSKQLSFIRTHMLNTRIKHKDRGTVVLYGVLFALCVLAVMKVLNYYLVLGIVVVAIFFLDRKNFKNPDYCLLFTFAFLFIFVGNIGRIEIIQDFLASIVSGNEVIASVLASQVISNVPASILLPNFTDQYMLVCIGADIGGLGTLIASMANLISFKQYARLEYSHIGKYVAYFTVVSILFVVPLTALALLVG